VEAFQLQQCTISSLHHLENERSWSINHCWSSILGNQGIARIHEIITALSTTIVLLNRKHRRNNIDSKITDVTTCKVIKIVFLDVNHVILIKYNYQTAKAMALYESTDGPTGQPADNLTQFRQVERCTSNRTQIDSSGILTTQTTSVVTVRFRPRP